MKRVIVEQDSAASPQGATEAEGSLVKAATALS